MRAMLITIVLSMVLAAGCAKDRDRGSTLTEHQRDSVLATEKIVPGSSAIGRAMSTADAESQRGATMQSQVDSLPH